MIWLYYSMDFNYMIMRQNGNATLIFHVINSFSLILWVSTSTDIYNMMENKRIL